MDSSFIKHIVVALLLILSACSSKPQAIHATWLEQAQFAEHLAEDIDPQALLFSVDASLDRPGVLESPISYMFRFARPDGMIIELQILDTIPPKIVNTTPENSFGNSSVLDNDQRELLERAMKSIKIGPRDVLEITKQQGNEFSEKNKTLINPRITLHMGAEFQQFTGVPAIWIVNYISSNEELYISIDPTNGAVLRESSDLLELSQ